MIAIRVLLATAGAAVLAFVAAFAALPLMAALAVRGVEAARTRLGHGQGGARA